MPSEAFAILDLPENADETAVKEAYRRLSLQKHPDRPGGDTEEQSQINDAYAIAMSVVAPQNAIALRTTQSIHRVELALLTERSARQADSAAKAIERRRRRRLDMLRNVSLLTGIAAGILLLFSDYLFDPLVEAAPEGVRRALKLQLY